MEISLENFYVHIDTDDDDDNDYDRRPRIEHGQITEPLGPKHCQKWSKSRCGF